MCQHVHVHEARLRHFRATPLKCVLLMPMEKGERGRESVNNQAIPYPETNE